MTPAAAALPAGHRLAVLLDPRFPGGTSTAAAAELRALAGRVDLRVVGLETAMFRGRSVHPELEAVLEAQGLEIDWMPPVVHADTIVFHNPSCLRFDVKLPIRLSCATALVVTHENFLRPNGTETHDVAACLEALARALVCRRRWLAPVSAYNRSTVRAWLERGSDWELAPADWFGVFDQPLLAPTAQPGDRRGRHSRPGPEKFPPRALLEGQFPAHAQSCILLGADALIDAAEPPPTHWDLRRFGSLPVERFLEEIDFLVYFTHPNWRESCGRVIAEAIAAGKVVITDPGTAQTFGPAVVACSGEGAEVDRIVAGFIADPAAYVRFVAEAQATLAGFGPEAFRARVRDLLAAAHEGLHAVV